MSEKLPTISRRSESIPNIVLTFDDGPDPIYTPKILDLLKKNEIKATFFAVGNRARDHPEILNRINDEGHTICNHTWSHPHLPALPSELCVEELMLTRDRIDTIIKNKTLKYHIFKSSYGTFYRAPYGEFPDFNTGFIGIGWSIDSGDWQANTEQIYNALISANAGDIILCHDGLDKEGKGNPTRDNTIAALEKAIPILKKRLNFVTIDQTIKDIRNKESWACLKCGHIMSAQDWMSYEIRDSEPNSERAYYNCPKCLENGVELS